MVFHALFGCVEDFQRNDHHWPYSWQPSGLALDRQRGPKDFHSEMLTGKFFQGVVLRYKGPSAAESILKFHRQLQNDKFVFIIMKSQQSCF